MYWNGSRWMHRFRMSDRKAHVSAEAPVDVDVGRPLAYLFPVEFEWDDGKSDDCFAHRGFDFAYAVRAFLDRDRLIGSDRRWDYGEERYRLLGGIEGRVFVVIYTMRGSVIRLISARKANRKEVQEYEQNTRQD